SGKRYQQSIDLSPNGIAIYQDGRIVSINQAGARLFGAASPSELLGKPVSGLVRPEHRARIENRLKPVSEAQGVDNLREEQFFKIDGTPVEIEMTALPYMYEGTPSVQAIFRDVTERRRMKEALESIEHRLQTVVSNIPIVLSAVDVNGVFTLSEGKGLNAL